MPLVGFKPTIPVFKRAKTFHALDHAAAVTSTCLTYYILIHFITLIIAIFVDYVSYPKLPKARRCFIAIAFQLCFRICH
jgi:hypothetical protein